MTASSKKLVVLVADIAGSAALYQRLNDMEAAHAIERCCKRMSRSIEAYQGQIQKTAGDEILALFPSAEAACQAAIDMQLRIADLPPVSGHKLSIRVGLHGSDDDGNGQVSGETTSNAIRVAGLARGEEILGSAAFASGLPANASVQQHLRTDLEALRENGQSLGIHQIRWSAQASAVSRAQPATAIPGQGASERLSVRYHGRSFVVDDKTPVLTLGRDPANKLVIEDRKASRQHARIERRKEGFHLVDTSTNGSFVSHAGRQEVMVRRHELLLESAGTICFGTSANDPAADRVEFEYL